MKNYNNEPKRIYINKFSEHSKEDLIKEILYNQKEGRNQKIDTEKILLKISKRLNILVWFLVFIPIVCTLIILLLS